MEFCSYCQKWIEPKKGVTDLVAGGLSLGLIGLAIGGAHYLLKGHRCPICNNVIKGHGMRPQLPIQAIQPPQNLNQYAPTLLPTQHAAQYLPILPVTQTTPMTTQHCPRCSKTMVYKHRYWHCYDCRTTTVARIPTI